MRLELRLTIWLTILLAASAALTLFGMARFQTESLEKQAAEAALALAGVTEDALEVSMLNNASDDVRRAVHNLERGELIEAVTVYRPNGTTWVSSSAPSTMELERRDALMSAMSRNRAVTSAADGSISVFVPIPKQADCVGCHPEETDVLGAVEVRLDQRPFEEGLTRSAMASLYLAAIPLFLGVLISILAVRRNLLRPLVQVGQAAEQLGKGDLSVRLPEFEAWELTQVSRTFNDMAGRLQSHNEGLMESLRKNEASLQALLRKTLTAQEEERRRIARELHDETSQVLSALMMNIDVLESQRASAAPAAGWSRERIEAVKSLAEEAARNLDKMMLDLRPALLDELGLIPAVRWYVAQASDLWGLEIEFEGDRLGRLPEHVEVAAFRIVQEAVSNAVRHAHADSAHVRISDGERTLSLEISDDGVGFDMGEVSVRVRAGQAVGLMGMRERAELAGGTLEVDSVPGGGTRITATIPLPEDEVATQGAERS